MLALVGPILSKVSLGQVEPMWSMLGTSWAYVEPMLAYLRPMLAYVGLGWAYVGVCWPHLGLCWPYVEPYWTLCWAYVEDMLAILALFWGHVRQFMLTKSSDTTFYDLSLEKRTFF